MCAYVSVLKCTVYVTECTKEYVWMCIWAYVIVNICVICQCECVSYVRGWVCTSVCSWVLLLSGEDHKQRGLTPVSAGLRNSMLSKGDRNGLDNRQTEGCLPTFALIESNRPTQIPGSWCCCLSGQQSTPMALELLLNNAAAGVWGRSDKFPTPGQAWQAWFRAPDSL